MTALDRQRTTDNGQWTSYRGIHNYVKHLRLAIYGRSDLPNEANHRYSKYSTNKTTKKRRKLSFVREASSPLSQSCRRRPGASCSCCSLERLLRATPGTRARTPASRDLGRCREALHAIACGVVPCSLDAGALSLPAPTGAFPSHHTLQFENRAQVCTA